MIDSLETAEVAEMARRLAVRFGRSSQNWVQRGARPHFKFPIADHPDRKMLVSRAAFLFFCER
jgi:hypothetical protein